MKGEFLNAQPAGIPTQEKHLEAEAVREGKCESLVPALETFSF